MTEPRTGSRKDRLSRLQQKAADYQVHERPTVAGEAEVASGPLVRLLQISRAMNRIHDRDELLDYVIERLRELFHATNGFVVLFDENGAPQVQASRSHDGGPEAPPLSATILRAVRESRRPTLIDNTAEIEELKNQSSIERYRIASVLCAPMVVNDEVIGVLPGDAPWLRAEFYLPMGLSPDDGRDNHFIRVIARLRDGVSIDAARAELVPLAARLEARNAPMDEE